MMLRMTDNDQIDDDSWKCFTDDFIKAMRVVLDCPRQVRPIVAHSMNVVKLYLLRVLGDEERYR